MKYDHSTFRFGFLVTMTLLIAQFYMVSGIDDTSPSIKEQISNTGLLADGDEEMLFVTTLDGALHAVTKATGTKKWTLKEDPVIQNPINLDDPPIPRFFPNPQDGSLYRYTASRGTEPLKKLPFTIPELVANSPCRSNDGIFYIGKKVDSWVGVDSITGKKQLSLGSDTIEKVCPKQSTNTIYLGRTLYNIVLFELNTGHKWNVSFYHYTTSSAPEQLQKYDLVHYSATGEGSVLTVDQKTGAPLWNLEFESPVVGMYILSADKTFASVPVTTVTPQTLQRFSYNLNELSQMEAGGKSDHLLIKELSPTIFVGESANGVYALPAFVDTNTARISRRQSHLLLGGPEGQRATLGPRPDQEEGAKEGAEVLLLGYYDLPESLKSELHKASARELIAAGLPLGITHQDNLTEGDAPGSEDSGAESQETPHVFWHGVHQIGKLNTSFVSSGDVFRWAGHVGHLSLSWFLVDPLNFMVTLLTACLGVVIVLLYRQAQEYARLSREVSSSRRNPSSSTSSSRGGSTGEVTAVAEELDGGVIRVNKITFEPEQVLGKGCDGTFVFRGTFDGRSVAVKRVLPGCFSIADREVDLLRESDRHPNVIRYFCMEQCREFRYIALELCTATLEDYVQGRVGAQIPPLVLLRQATAGLHHLHFLDIVHRDIKPSNVLLSSSSSKGDVRAMISDFGLCKRLESGRMSFSKKSGVTGTEGWIAPEMMMTSGRPTTKVDIFSLGCVFFYVLKKGKHPFGSLLDRQSNIIAGKYILSPPEEPCPSLDGAPDPLPLSLIEGMVSASPPDRPPTNAVLAHPLFWTPDKILQFFQDVSDRVECESGCSRVMTFLERDHAGVVRADWTRHMHPVIGEDLRRFREYNGRSVRDLLRAMRNKKNHYRELCEDARRVFGRIPEEFVPYWTLRFPRLLIHTWHAMQCCKGEPIFNKYYFAKFNFRMDPLHETVSLSPNNRRSPFSPAPLPPSDSPAPSDSPGHPKKKPKGEKGPLFFLGFGPGACHTREGAQGTPETGEGGGTPSLGH